MITPHPESDLSLNTLVVGADIVKILKDNKKYMIVEELLKKFLSKDKRRTHALFFDTLTFLYIIEIVKEKNFKVRLNYGYTQKTLF